MIEPLDHDDPSSPEARLDVALKQVAIVTENIGDYDAAAELADATVSINSAKRLLGCDVATDGGAVEYETVGVVNADVAAKMPTDGRTIVIEHEDPDTRLLARPKGGDGDV